MGVAERFAAAGITVLLAGRTIESLNRVRDRIRDNGGNAESYVLDLADDTVIARCTAAIAEQYPEIHVLVNCGGQFLRGRIGDTDVSRFDELWKINVHGTLTFTRSLLKPLIAGDADIVFLNSTSVFYDAPGVGYFAATQHALQGLANTLRAELNDLGPRVLSIFPGRTATPRQENIHDSEGKPYKADRLLQTADIAELVLACISLPRTAEVMDVRIRPRQKT